MVTLAGEVLRLVPLRALPRLIARDVVGFCYHTVSECRQPAVSHLYSCRTPAQFERDLEFVCREYEPVPYDDLVAGRVAAATGRPRAIVTFDDGLKECYSIIRPLLLKYGVPAVFFVTTGLLDNRRLFYRNKVSLCIDTYLRLSRTEADAARSDLEDLMGAPVRGWRDLAVHLHRLTPQAEELLDAVSARLGVDADAYLRTNAPYLTTAQVRGLARDGFTIGAHGLAHLRLYSMTPAEAEADIVSSCETVARMVDRPTVPYAFPFDGRGVSREMLRAVRSQHSHVGLFFDSRGLARDRDFVINRIVVDSPTRATHQVTNLPAYVRNAYAVELARAVIAARILRWRGDGV